MDHFFQYDTDQGYMLWLDGEDFSVNQSAFSRYIRQPIEGFVAESYGDNSKTRNVNKRMIEFLKRSWTVPVNETRVTDQKERGHKHMISERLRREKQKQNYLALHKMLPLGTKGDKNSIIQMATMKIQELQRYKEELRGRNYELEMILAATDENKLEEVEKAQIKVRVANPASGIDSMLEVLKCLRNTGSTTTAMQFRFSLQEVSAQLEIETKIGAAEVEKAVNTTLWEAEKKLRAPFQGISEA